jgi:hypothetical protein
VPCVVARRCVIANGRRHGSGTGTETETGSLLGSEAAVCAWAEVGPWKMLLFAPAVHGDSAASADQPWVHDSDRRGARGLAPAEAAASFAIEDTDVAAGTLIVAPALPGTCDGLVWRHATAARIGRGHRRSRAALDALEAALTVRARRDAHLFLRAVGIGAATWARVHDVEWSAWTRFSRAVRSPDHRFEAFIPERTPQRRLRGRAGALTRRDRREQSEAELHASPHVNRTPATWFPLPPFPTPSPSPPPLDDAARSPSRSGRPRPPRHFTVALSLHTMCVFPFGFGTLASTVPYA